MANDCCRRCGKAAPEACSGCKDARYCSKYCQKWDWKVGGHRALCKGPASNRRLRLILGELFQAEWEWLISLSPSDKLSLFDTSTEMMILNHAFRSGEVALVLARATHAALLTHVQFCRPPYGRAYYVNVLLRWYKRHQDFLNSQGFYIEFVSHGVYMSDMPAQPAQVEGELLDFAHGGCALIKDISSPKIDLVNDVFGMKRWKVVQIWTKDAKKAMTSSHLFDCSFFRLSVAATQDTGSRVEYYFEYPKQVFGDYNVCCSPCVAFEFLVDPADASALGEHFYKSYQAMAKLGFILELAIHHATDWSDKAVADAYWAATGKNRDTFEQWLENGTTLSLRGRRYDRVIARIRAMDDKK